MDYQYESYVTKSYVFDAETCTLLTGTHENECFLQNFHNDFSRLI